MDFRSWTKIDLPAAGYNSAELKYQWWIKWSDWYIKCFNAEGLIYELELQITNISLSKFSFFTGLYPQSSPLMVSEQQRGFMSHF